MNVPNRDWKEITPQEAAPVLLRPIEVIAPGPVSDVQKAPQNYGTLSDRALAHCIDAIVVHGFSLYASQLLPLVMAKLLRDQYGLGTKIHYQTVVELLEYTSFAVWALSFATLSFAYTVCFTHYFGRTLGKAFFSLRVVGEAGARPSLKQSIIRYCLYFGTYLTAGIPFVAVAAAKKGVSYHDLWSETKVIRDES